MDSVWRNEIKEFGELNGEVSCDAAVVGGGLAGVLTAYRLSNAGLRTVLLESGKIGNGQTCGTTAKISLCQGTKLSHIERSFGTDSAALFAKSQLEAIDEYEKIIRENKIQCDFKILPAYLYALYGERHIRCEFETAVRCGVPCLLTKETELPFEVTLSLKFDGQAQFDPLRFIGGIIDNFDVYENTKALSIEPYGVKCENGRVKAKNVVVTTNYPALCDKKKMFFVKLHRRTAYACAFENCRGLEGMYVGVDGGYNYRSFSGSLIVSGESHVTGLGSGGAYERLRKNTLMHFNGATLTAEWSAEDAESLDGLPYIGRIVSHGENIFVATGFGTWGMTNSMVASGLICDLICGRQNEGEKLFSPKRLKMNSSADELSDGVTRAFDGIALSRLKSANEIADLPCDYGMIVRYRGKKAAVYKDRDGELHASEAYCPHMKCELSWNDDDKTWDCPCHGSRFDVDGNLIAGPATKDV